MVVVSVWKYKSIADIYIKLSNPVKRQTPIQFVSRTVVKATILFKSTCKHILEKASNKPTIDKIKTKFIANVEVVNIIDLYKQINPNFTKKPLKKIENSVDASTWALSSQEVKGQSGSLTEKPNSKNNSNELSMFGFKNKFGWLE